MANGCIPLFKDINTSPKNTLTSLPKPLLSFLSTNYDKIENTQHFSNMLLEHTKRYCSTSASANYFLSKLNKLGGIKNILLIRCDKGVNYSRELMWIGLKRYIQSISGVAVELPKIDYLYKDCRGDVSDLYGMGFTYAKRVDSDYDFTDEEIKNKIKNNFWDLIIFGKVGPDELSEGSIPNLPLWDQVIQIYDKSRIVFIYGGDECIDLTYDNRYNNHIQYHRKFGTCFVRELNM
jgi:hypothetical protein